MAAYSIVDSLALLDDDKVLGGGLEGVWEGSFGLFESGSQLLCHHATGSAYVATARPSADLMRGSVRLKIG